MKFMKVIIASLIMVLGVNLAANAVDYVRTSTIQSMNVYTPTTGSTVTLTRANDTVAILNPAGSLAALTVAMPSSPKDGDRVTLTANSAITSLTFTNGTVANGPASLSAGSSFAMVYSSTSGAWNQSGGIGGSGGLDKIVGISGSVNGAVVRLTSGAYGLASSTCNLFADATTCAKALGYADPRAFGTSTTCTNSSIDDSAAIQAAINTGVPVMIPYPRCTVMNKMNFTNDGQTIFSFGQGGRYNSNYPANPYIRVLNNIWDNRATSLNCVFDTRGYDNVTIRNVAIRGEYNLVGTVAICNSVGIQSGRGAAFLNLENVSFLNIGNGIGAAMESYFDYIGTSTSSVTLGTGSQSFTTDTSRLWTAGNVIRATASGISPATYMDGTVTSYDSATGEIVINVTSTTGTAGTYTNWALSTSNRCTPISTGPQSGLYANVFQLRMKGVDFIGNCFGAYGNFTDVHLTDFYMANNNHNGMSTLPGYGGAWDISNGRVEYNGFGAGPSSATTYYNGGAGLYFDSFLGFNVNNVTCDHQYGTCITGGPSSKNINLTNIHSMGSYYGARAGITDQCHFAFKGTKGLTANGITTQRNGVNTPYVACFSGSNNYVNWNGAGGAAGSGADTGQWQTAYFLFTTTPTNFSYNVPGVGIQLSNLVGYTETPYDIGNSSTAFTIDLLNGTFQKVTATGNATVTMPSAVNGKSFTLRYYTGAGGFTASFTGVKWSGGAAPTLTSTASRMDVFSFISDGTNWYGSVVQNFTP